MSKSCAVFVRNDLTLMITSGDESMEVALTPRGALEIAASLLNVGLEVAEKNSQARTGAMGAIETAREKSSEE